MRPDQHKGVFGTLWCVRMLLKYREIAHGRGRLQCCEHFKCKKITTDRKDTSSSLQSFIPRVQMYVHKSSSTKMTKQQDQLKRSWLRCIELSCLNLLLLLWQWKESRINGSKFIDVMMQYGTYNFRVLGIWKVTQKHKRHLNFNQHCLGHHFDLHVLLIS